MEQQPQPEINPESLVIARTVVENLGFGDYADATVEHGGVSYSIVEGFARHMDDVRGMDGTELYKMVSGYVALAKAQQSERA